ncbi:MAG: hypothetical protein HYZ18_01430 [Pseudogulbenkiania sp.]|nr:hypothetical protein [Pseudogulbenkiania sp.]
MALINVPGRGAPGSGMLDVERLFALIGRLPYPGGCGAEYHWQAGDDFSWPRRGCPRSRHRSEICLASPTRHTQINHLERLFGKKTCQAAFFPVLSGLLKFQPGFFVVLPQQF